MAVISLLRRVRDGVAERWARAVLRWPILEASFVTIGRAFWGVRLAGRLYTRATEVVVEGLRMSDRRFRRVSIGTLSPWLDVTEFAAREAYFVGVLHEPQTTRYVLAHVGPGDIVVDIGANQGYYTVIAATLVGEAGRVFAFDPNPDILGSLARHVQLNGLERRVEVHDVALSDAAAGETTFYLPGDDQLNSGAASLLADWNPRELFGGSEAAGVPAKRAIRVRADTFDQWCRRRGIERIDLMKIDVEGAEEKVLRGMRRTLELTPPRAIVCETTWKGRAHTLLEGYGYHAQPLDWIVPGFGNLLFTPHAERPVTQVVLTRADRPARSAETPAG